ncbi:hypothetical protein KY290_038376 [Solanum tuberosum]|uniref:Uncharacterized protein n=1 Tax=Solanum tuberosum TaxID=4113 RepID=A0ABQ7TYR2_SOLTU|nr:hypothetical protein KY289_036517 [Solanum tuberosum]KAH0739671.1 hypothetical protein KY290_038376 [Solanum tuberosum]
MEKCYRLHGYPSGSNPPQNSRASLKPPQNNPRAPPKPPHNKGTGHMTVANVHCAQDLADGKGPAFPSFIDILDSSDNHGTQGNQNQTVSDGSNTTYSPSPDHIVHLPSHYIPMSVPSMHPEPRRSTRNPKFPSHMHDYVCNMPQLKPPNPQPQHLANTATSLKALFSNHQHMDHSTLVPSSQDLLILSEASIVELPEAHSAGNS